MKMSEHPDGSISYEFHNMEEFRSYLKMKAEMALTPGRDPLQEVIQRTAESVHLGSDLNAPVPPPTITGNAPRAISRRRVPNPPTPIGPWPKTIYITEPWNRAYQILKKYHNDNNFPQGMTSEEIAIELKEDHSIVSGWLGRLRKGSPLVEMRGHNHRLTEIGADPELGIVITNHPKIHNRRLGWGRFMASGF